MRNVREKVYLSFFQDRSLTAHSILTPLLTSSSSILNWFTRSSILLSILSKQIHWVTDIETVTVTWFWKCCDGRRKYFKEWKWQRNLEKMEQRGLCDAFLKCIYILIGLPTYHRRLFHNFFSIPLISGMEKNLWNKRLCYLPILFAPGGT